MHSFTQRLRQSSFVRHNAIYFAGSVLIGFLNYLYYPVLGRLLEPAAFGEVQTLASLFLQMSIFLGVLGLITVNITANYDDVAWRNRIILELEKLALLTATLVLALAVVFGGVLKDYFRFGSSLPFAVLGLAIVVTVPYMLRSAYLNGRQQFGLNALAGIVGAGSKLVLSVGLVALSLGTSGALLGIVLAQLLALAVATSYTRRHGFASSWHTHAFSLLPDMRLVAPELKYALLVLTGSLTITVLYSVDIVVIKHYFDAHTAGLYAGVATVARIIFFLTASVAQVLMPSVRLNRPARENTQLLVKSLVLLLTLGGGALVVFAIAPRLIIRLLMGGDYVRYAGLLPRLGLAIFVISIVNLFVTYYMALRRYAIGLIAVAGALLTYGLMLLNHDTPEAVVSSLLYGSGALAMAVVGWAVVQGKGLKTQGGGSV